MGVEEDLFGAEEDSLGVEENLFWGEEDDLGGKRTSFCGERGPFWVEKDLFLVEEDQFWVEDDLFGVEEDNFVQEEDDLGGKRTIWGGKEDYFGGGLKRSSPFFSRCWFLLLMTKEPSLNSMPMAKLARDGQTTTTTSPASSRLRVPPSLSPPSSSSPQILGDLAQQLRLLLLHHVHHGAVDVAKFGSCETEMSPTASLSTFFLGGGCLEEVRAPQKTLRLVLTVTHLLQHLVLELKEEGVVILHLLRWIHHQGPHQVGAVGLVTDAHGARDGPEVHVVLVATAGGGRR